MPVISIIVPVYGVEEQLQRCLDSILSQTFQDFEILCVNDASPDRCGAILDEYADRDARIKVFHFAENRGVGAARNYAIQKASGELLCVCDPDDLLPPQSLENRYIAWEDNHAVVRGQRVEITASGASVTSQDYKYEYSKVVFAPSLEIKHLKLLVSHTIWLFNTSMIHDYKIQYEETMSNSQDSWFMTQIFFRIPRMIWIPDIVYCRIFRKNSTINKPYNLQNYINFSKPAQKFYEESVKFSKISFGDKYFSDNILFVFDKLQVNKETNIDMERDFDALINYIVSISDKYGTFERIFGNKSVLKNYLGIVYLHFLMHCRQGSSAYRLYKSTNLLKAFLDTGKL
jgi:glycosyltransferase involved in cell wall biosynthesis